MSLIGDQSTPDTAFACGTSSAVVRASRLTKNRPAPSRSSRRPSPLTSVVTRRTAKRRESSAGAASIRLQGVLLVLQYVRRSGALPPALSRQKISAGAGGAGAYRSLAK